MMAIADASALLFLSLLVATRVAPVLLSIPVFSFGNIPTSFRVIFSLTLAAALVAALDIPLSLPQTPLSIATAFLSEFVIGAIFAFGIHAAFGVFHVAGDLFDFQVGFGIANVIDPVNHQQEPLAGVLLRAMAVSSFFLIGGHHLLLKGLSLSLARIPLGTPFWLLNFKAIMMQFGIMFTLGLALVMPVVITLLLTDIGVGIVSRFMPQMNVFSAVLPAKVGIGLLVLVLTLGQAGPLIERAFSSIFVYWSELAA